ncbi:MULTISPECIES: DUF1629 domain-containing protein [unclassified Gilliamella]|uniref:imm11 family protein n=1 Tax=unclassified Gilliamella TaxID=2685620 RepID=UPI001306CFA8|nr:MULTISPECIES: DUF1629 domain-containing protein [unclassified Gilliamella]MWP49044.1 hypothetical protein [Gilliamella sp. Lep-s35]MWP68871.1 hypothetical protein [Gilliamella sp. Lep-s5]MWP76905.1 hypothetical protein [Gilliamella sp. Lep-s21]
MENYYFIRRKSDQAYPLIREVGYEPEDDDRNATLVYLEFNGTIPRNPVMADFLSGPEVYITDKIIEVIKSFTPKGVRFIETELTTPKGDLIEDYFCLKTENRYHAMDKEKSEFTYKYLVYNISKFILDKKVLNKIPLEERLIFVLRESPSKILFHETVAKAIMDVNPTGMVFINIETGGEPLG